MESLIKCGALHCFYLWSGVAALACGYYSFAANVARLFGCGRKILRPYYWGKMKRGEPFGAPRLGL